MVALEALACGCVPIVSQSGGLPDAVGRCGIVVPKNDSEALSHVIVEILSNKEKRENLLANATEHLANHTREHVARRYLDVIENAYRSHS